LESRDSITDIRTVLSVTSRREKMEHVRYCLRYYRKARQGYREDVRVQA
jgi:hypothetical protein